MLEGYKPEYESARDYAQAHMQEKRDAAAQQVRELRTRDQVWSAHKKTEARESLETYTASKRHLQEEIAYLQDQIEKYNEQLKLSFVEKLFGETNEARRKRKFAQEFRSFDTSTFERRKHDLEQATRMITSAELNLEELENLKKRPHREQIDSILAHFHEEEQAQWQAHEYKREVEQTNTERIERERPYRTIEHLAKKHGVYFLHGTNPSYTPIENSLFENHVSWRDKLRIAIALQPTLSASSLRPEYDGFENLFAGVGVLLRGGRIDAASPGDAATVARSLTERTANIGRMDNAANPATLDGIEQVIKQGPQQFLSNKHNEYTVARPDVAGLYYVADEIDDEVLQHVYKVPSHVELYKMSNESNLPVFALKNGRLFPVDYDEHTKVFKRKDVALDAEAVPGLPGVPADQRTALQEQLIAEYSDLVASARMYLDASP